MNNRRNNPNEYSITNNLGQRTRIRHSQIIQAIIDEAIKSKTIRETKTDGTTINNTNTDIDLTSWTKVLGKTGKRLGGRRSADGMIYDLPNADITLPQFENNKVVMKVIFSNDKNPESEVKITKILGDKRIGPKLFFSFRIDISPGQLVEFVKKLKKPLTVGGKSYVNFFQQFAANGHNFNLDYTSSTKIYIIVMENLFYNPAHGVEEAYQFDDIMNGKAPPRVIIPLTQVKNKMKKMHLLGVIHGDLHTGNGLVQIIKSKTSSKKRLGVRFYDFGRSINVGRPISNLTTANTNLKSMSGGTSSRPFVHFKTPNGIASHIVGPNRLPRLRNKAALNIIQNKALQSRKYNITYNKSARIRRNESANAAAAQKAAANAAAAQKAAANAAAAQKEAENAAKKAAANAAAAQKAAANAQAAKRNEAFKRAREKRAVAKNTALKASHKKTVANAAQASANRAVALAAAAQASANRDAANYLNLMNTN